MFLKRLFYASASILMLVVAYHLGASTARAQAPSNPLVGIAAYSGALFGLTANGYVYSSGDNGNSWRHNGNVFVASTATATQSFGSLKAKYR